MTIVKNTPSIMGPIPDYTCTLDSDRANLPSDVSIGKTAFVAETGVWYIHCGGGNWQIWNSTATSLATIITNIGNPAAHILTSIVAKLGNLARSLTAILGTRWDVSGDLGTDVALSLANETEIAQLGDGDLVLIKSINTTTTTKNATVTLFALDAIGGSKKDIKFGFYLAADAAATFTPTLWKSRPGDTGTLTQVAIPAIAAIATPAAAAEYLYDIGFLEDGCQMEIRLAQSNAGNATNVCDATLSYLGGL